MKNKQVLIIGAGAMSRAIAYDLLNSNPAYHVTVMDKDQEVLNRLVRFINSNDVDAIIANADDIDSCRKLFKWKDIIIGAAGYSYNVELTKLAIESGASWVDLGGNNDVVARQFDLDEEALSKDVTIVPDCGLAPGMVNIIAGDAVNRLDEVNELHFRVGGLPQKPKPPLFYGLVFSADGLANEYSEPSLIIENGNIIEVEPLTGLEKVQFGAPYGILEAFHTSGGSSTMVRTFDGIIKNLDYKTLRYPGHLRRVKLLYDLGFFNNQEIDLGSGNFAAPRKLFAAMLERFGWITEDIVVLDCWALGKRNDKSFRIEYRLLDSYDPQTELTAMARTTGFSAAVIARMILEGAISAKGVIRQEVSVPPNEYFSALKERNIEIKITEKKD
ncbi:saccharopine dehydrogenase NADP-binding domain-containing protein [bacterium]|nr:saccharopine dehydrogenase NADP-binding domain-containing protein [bacterium]